MTLVRETVQSRVEREHAELLEMLLNAGALEAYNRLLQGWLTPAQVWLKRLPELSASVVRNLEPGLLYKAYHELEPLDQGRFILALREKGWKVAELKDLLGASRTRMHQLLHLTELSPAIQKKLSTGELSEHLVRATPARTDARRKLRTPAEH